MAVVVAADASDVDFLFSVISLLQLLSFVTSTAEKSAMLLGRLLRFRTREKSLFTDEWISGTVINLARREGERRKTTQLSLCVIEMRLNQQRERGKKVCAHMYFCAQQILRNNSFTVSGKIVLSPSN